MQCLWQVHKASIILSTNRQIGNYLELLSKHCYFVREEEILVKNIWCNT